MRLIHSFIHSLTDSLTHSTVWTWSCVSPIHLHCMSVECPWGARIASPRGRRGQGHREPAWRVLPSGGKHEACLLRAPVTHLPRAPSASDSPRDISRGRF